MYTVQCSLDLELIYYTTIMTLIVTRFIVIGNSLKNNCTDLTYLNIWLQ